MVKALFDTNILIDFLSGRPEARREIDLHEDRAISIVTWMEVMVGATPDTEARLRGFLSGFEVVDIDQDGAEAAVDLRRRHRIKLPDALIWAAARRSGALLVTRNTRDFPVGDPGIRAPYA